MKEILGCLFLIGCLAFLVYSGYTIYCDSKKAQIEREARIKAYDNIVRYLPLIYQNLSDLNLPDMYEQ